MNRSPLFLFDIFIIQYSNLLQDYHILSHLPFCSSTLHPNICQRNPFVCDAGYFHFNALSNRIII